MKILHIFHHSNLVNGVDKTTCTLIIALKKLGILVSAIVPDEGDVTDFLKQHNIIYHIVPYSCCMSLTQRAQFRFLADSANQQELLLSFIKKTRPDVIHINTGHLLHAGLAAAQLKIPAIWHIHSPFDHDLIRYQTSIGTEGYAWMLEQLSSRIIGVSNDVKISLTEHLPADRIQTLYNGIDVETTTKSASNCTINIRHELALPDNAKIVIGVGRISEAKNFASFVRVAKLIVKFESDIYFIIVGPKQESQAVVELENELLDSKLSGKVFVLGARLDVPALIKQSNCFLSTAIIEGQGIAAIEAMALQKPVVAMACSGLRECIKHEHDGILVAMGNEQAASTNIITILNNPKLACQLGQNGKQSVIDRFSSIEYAKKFILISKQAVAFGAAPISSNSLAFTQGMISEITQAHHRLLKLESETLLQHCRRNISSIIHQIRCTFNH